MSIWENLECDCGNKVFALSDNCHNEIRVQCVHCRKERFWKVKVIEFPRVQTDSWKNRKLEKGVL